MFGCSSLTDCAKYAAALPLPRFCLVVWLVTSLVVPHSNQADVDVPPGLVTPLNSADEEVTELCSRVATLRLVVVGVSPLPVVNDRTSPSELAPLEERYAVARK